MLVSQLTSYVFQEDPNADDPPVVLGNIGMSISFGGTETYLNGRIVLSLVNIMEESTMKNASAYQMNNGRPELANPPAFLNLFLLFTANFNNPPGNNGDSVAYNNSITRLSQVIEFFQSKRVFTVQNSPDPNIVQDPDLQDLRVAMDLYSMTFEQVNHLWGSLGGKQAPFVMYKAWITPVKRDLVTKRGELIRDVETNTIQLTT